MAWIFFFFNIDFLWHKVEPNQEFQGLVCEGANVLPSKFLEDAFRDGYGMFCLYLFMLMYIYIYIYHIIYLFGSHISKCAHVKPPLSFNFGVKCCRKSG